MLYFRTADSLFTKHCACVIVASFHIKDLVSLVVVLVSYLDLIIQLLLLL